MWGIDLAIFPRMNLRESFGIFIFLFFLCFFTKSLAESHCSVDLNDRYAPNAVMPPEGNPRFVGKCLDTQSSRALRIAKREDLSAPRDLSMGPFVYVANFKHDQKFWIAEIPFTHIKDFILQREIDERKIAFHHQLRLLMHESFPIKLYPQTADQVNHLEDPIEISDFVLTGYNFRIANADPGEDLRFTMVKAMKGYFVQGFVISSMADIFKYETTNNRDFEQYSLTLTQDQRSKVFEHLINRFDQVRETKIYHLLKYNCITELFDGLYTVLPFNSNFEKKMFYATTIRQTIPMSVVPQLQRLGFIADYFAARKPNYRLEISR